MRKVRVPDLSMAMRFVCTHCTSEYALAEPVWRCSCGGPLDFEPDRPFHESLLDDSERGPWRYSTMLPEVPRDKRVSIGEQCTPLLSSDCLGSHVLFKLDFLFPTGSYKDRGAAVMISMLSALGVGHVVDDSSGNAGASIAAYAGAAGIRCTIYAPSANSPIKLAQIRAYGADLVEIHGNRAQVAKAAQARVGETFYASHNWHPAFHAGVATMAFEMWEQLGRTRPDAVIAPAGNGSIILGLHKGFHLLRKSGCLQRPPRLYAVQSDAYPSLAEAFRKGVKEPKPMSFGETIAEGIATSLPPKGREVLRALHSSKGAAITVSDEEIRDTFFRLAAGGFYVEPTAAVGGAGYMKLIRKGVLSRNGATIVILTGSGLKAPVGSM